MRSLLLAFPFLFILSTFNLKGQYANQIRETPAILGDLNFESMQFSYYNAEITAAIETFFKNDSIGRDLNIIICTSPGQSSFFSVQVKPYLNKLDHERLLSNLNSLKTPTPLYIPQSNHLKLQLNGGSVGRKDKPGPAHLTNDNHPINTYKDQSLDTQFNLVKTWIKDGVFPLLLKTVAYAGLEDNVQSYLGDLTSITWNGSNLADKYTINNPLYWRALEKSKLIPSLLPAIKIFFLIYDGRFEYARTYLNIIYNLHSPPDYLKYLLEETFDRAQQYELTEKKWSKNLYYVKLGGDSKKAVAECLQIIDINGNSTHALANLIEINATTRMDSSFNYDTYEDKLLHAQPMLNYLFFVWTKEDAFEQHLRKKVIHYFIDPESIESDYFNYLETAIQLKDYSIAADLTHLIVTNNSVSENSPIDLDKHYKYALYKLDKLGNIDQQNRKLKREFKRLDRRFRKQMKRHISYKAFNP